MLRNSANGVDPAQKKNVCCSNKDERSWRSKDCSDIRYRDAEFGFAKLVSCLALGIKIKSLDESQRRL